MLLVEDRALLDAFRRGERAALEHVFEHYAPRVSRWVTVGFAFSSKGVERRFRGFRSAVDAHDAIHEVFRAAFEERARHGYSGLAPYEGWLFVVTRNVVMKKLGVRELDLAGDVELEVLASSDPTPEEIVAREEENQIVRAYLATLSEDERRFVALRFSEQQSQHAVGEALGWSRKKVRICEESIRRGLTRFL